MKVQLSDIIEALEFTNSENAAYVNLKSGEIVILSESDMSAAEDDLNIENYPEWQKENIRVAKELILDDNKDYIELPDDFEIDEYHMMQQFIESISDNQIAQTLSISIKGSGAFRRFKEHIYQLGIQEQWFRFKNNEYKQRAIQWCEENKIDYIEE